MSRRLVVALLHHPVVDRRGEVFTTTLTGLDMHDMARSSRTFGAEALPAAGGVGVLAHEGPVPAAHPVRLRLSVPPADGGDRSLVFPFTLPLAAVAR